MFKLNSKIAFLFILTLPLVFSCKGPNNSGSQSNPPPAPITPPIQEGRCGNGILDADEECDTDILNGKDPSQYSCGCDCKLIRINE